MAEQPVPKFENQPLKEGIEQIAAEIRAREGKDLESGREAVKTALQAHVQAAAASTSSQTLTDAETTVLPKYMTDEPADVRFQVEKLIDVAWHKSIGAAVKIARKGSPLVLDALHDALTDKLYEELKRRGHIK